ncbi:nucleolar MIF4G domain-containing protein 1-like isoform X2 [Acropora millepora]|uniref:nucleolar MIF4G domain-containing protein 1-like isoform X2 n=1 Tax=Acropora millepora TaxID=45264 RepID=UPI0010FCDA7C|nr:nucleolar MIF4G domain-containing protein 1-like isoform X2 [Acropora millepora]
MADGPPLKRKFKETNEFFVIRAKGVSVKFPKGQAFDGRDFSKAKGKEGKIIGRRDLRKQARIDKKAKRAASFAKKKEQFSELPNVPSEQNTNSSESKVATKRKKKRKRRKQSKEITGPQDNYKMILAEDNAKEDKEIKKLEKLLKINKKQKVPSKFSSDGLDYLLEVCDTEMMTGVMSDKVCSTRQKKSVSKTSVNQVGKPGNDDVSCSKEDNNDDNEDAAEGNREGNDSNEDSISDYECEEHEEEEDEEDMEIDDKVDDDDDGVNNAGSDSGHDDDADEDRSKKNIILDSQKYVPPHLRKQESDAHQERLNKIRRQMKGLLNRLSEGNMYVISNEIENLFLHNSRNDMNKILTDIILDSCVSVSLMPDKLLMEHIMLLTILASRIGMEVGAFFIEKLAEVFDSLHDCEKDSYGQGKECVNVVALFAYLYNFKVIHCSLIYDIIGQLVDAFTEQDIELLLFLLKSTGAEIRKDDPGSLKDIILQIQAKAVAAPNLSNNLRVRFMLEIISNLRNNNLKKIPGYDPSRIEHLRKVLRSVVRNSNQAADIQIQVSLKDLLKPETKGRWWMTGSSLDRIESEFEATSFAARENTKLLELARKQRMNTDVRKNIFLVIMTSEDYVDAFEKVLKLSLKDTQTREVVYVLIDCCLQEKTYNPFYAYLGQKFCDYNRSYQVTFQFSFWDKFKIINDLAGHSVDNLSRLMAHLVASRALSLSILKVVNFLEMEKPCVRLFTQLFQHILLNYSKDITKNVFERISAQQNLSSLRQNLRIFIKHFVGKGKIFKNYKSIDAQERLQLVDDVLAAADATKL